MKDITKISLKENLKAHINTGAISNVDPVGCWFRQPKSPMDSWFIVGHFQTEGEVLDFLVHILSMNRGEKAQIVDMNASITNETTGEYTVIDQLLPLSLVGFEECGEGEDKILKISMGELCQVTGNLYESRWIAALPEGRIDVNIKGYGMVLNDTATCTFPTCFYTPFNQYSVPYFLGSGEIELKGRKYQVSDCRVWFDRQWDVEREISAEEMEKAAEYTDMQNRWTWTWMDLNLDNGEVLSLWDMNNIGEKENYSWATVLHQDGSQSVVTVTNLVEDASEYWKSDVSGQNYPTKFVVRIPDYDAVLEVTSVKKEQEMTSEIPMMNKYEGASVVKGIYKGKEVSGYAYIEMLGTWE